MVDFQPFINFCVKYEVLFTVWVQFIFLALGIGVFYYAFKSRKLPDKMGHPEFFKNEILLGILLIGAFIMYPFIFNRVFTDYAIIPEVRAQIFFHIWDSLQVNFILYYFHHWYSHMKKSKKGEQQTREDFNKEFLEKYDDSLWADLQRKWLHALPPAIGLTMIYLGNWLDPMLESQGWNGELLALFMIASVGIHFLVILTESDLIRQLKFHWMSKWANEWMMHALRPKELHTPTTANIMIISQMVFLFAPLPVFYAVLLITSVSDATASLVGKFFNRNGWAKHKIGNTNKTFVGLFAGMGSAFFLIYVVEWVVHFPGASPILIFGMAATVALAVGLIDIYARVIYDNFYNPIFTGTIVWLMYWIFVIL